MRPRRFLGPRRILQLLLLVAAVIALILAATGVLSPAFAWLLLTCVRGGPVLVAVATEVLAVDGAAALDLVDLDAAARALEGAPRRRAASRWPRGTSPDDLRRRVLDLAADDGPA